MDSKVDSNKIENVRIIDTLVWIDKPVIISIVVNEVSNQMSKT